MLLSPPADAHDLDDPPAEYLLDMPSGDFVRTAIRQAEPFHDEDVAYAERLQEAGVSTELVVIDGVFHGFDGIKADSAATRRFHDSLLAALARGLGVSSAT